VTGEIFDGMIGKIGLSRLIFLVGLGGTSLVGCGDDGTANPGVPQVDSGGAAGTDAGQDGAPAGRPPCPNPPVSDGELQNRASGPSGFGITLGGDPGWFDTLGGTECGLAGVRICQKGTDTCTESDQAGQFVLAGLPEDQDLEVTFEKPGSLKVLRFVHTGATPIPLRQTRLMTHEPALQLFARVGVVIDPNRGHLVGIPIAPGEGIGGFVLPDGVTMTLKPSGPRPLYNLGSESPNGLSSDELDPALESTRYGGWGSFVNVEPGDYAVRFERNGAGCTQALPGYGYGADSDGNIRVKVVAGYSGSLAAFCQ